MPDRIHLVDPDYRRRAGIAHRLQSGHWHVEVYEDLAEFCQATPSDGIVFAADDGHWSLAEIFDAIEAQPSILPVVLYAERPTTEMVVAAMSRGALSYLEWPFKPDVLFTTIETLATGVQGQLEHARRGKIAREKVKLLSRRESDVLRALLRGLSNRQIGQVLGISPRTVEIHRGKMMLKLGSRSISDAVRIAIYAGLDRELEEDIFGTGAHDQKPLVRRFDRRGGLIRGNR